MAIFVDVWDFDGREIELYRDRHGFYFDFPNFRSWRISGNDNQDEKAAEFNDRVGAFLDAWRNRDFDMVNELRLAP